MEGSENPGNEGSKKNPDVEFILVTGQARRQDPDTLRRIRSHAQFITRRRNPPTPRHPLTFELNLPAVMGQIQDRPHPSPRPPASGATGLHTLPGDGQAGPALSTVVSPAQARAGDLLVMLPGERHSRFPALWDHLYDGTSSVFKVMLEVGFVDIVREFTGLTQLLSAAAWDLEQAETRLGNEDGDDIEYAAYSVLATQSLRQKLLSPNTRATDEVVVAILAFAAYGFLIRDPKLVDVHLDGLSHVLMQRGGLASVESMPVIRIMIHWVDVNSAYLQDRQPRYPQPIQLVARKSRMQLYPEPVGSVAPGIQLHENPMIMRICNYIQQVNSIMAGEVTRLGDSFWATNHFCGYHFAPIMHELLSMPRGSNRDALEVRRRECFRIAGLMYIGTLRAVFRMADSTAPEYASKLLTLLETQDILPSWGQSDLFLFWCLMVASCHKSIPLQLRRRFIEILSGCAKAAQIGSFEDLRVMVTRFLWGDAVLGHLSAELEAEMPPSTWVTS